MWIESSPILDPTPGSETAPALRYEIGIISATLDDTDSDEDNDIDDSAGTD
jgi:hypothetical protein